MLLLWYDSSCDEEIRSKEDRKIRDWFTSRYPAPKASMPSKHDDQSMMIRTWPVSIISDSILHVQTILGRSCFFSGRLWVCQEIWLSLSRNMIHFNFFADDLDVKVFEMKDKSYTKLSPELLRVNELALGGFIAWSKNSKMKQRQKSQVAAGKQPDTWGLQYLRFKISFNIQDAKVLGCCRHATRHLGATGYIHEKNRIYILQRR